MNLLSYSELNVSWLTVAGLAWDCAGAWFLAKALIFNRDLSIAFQASSFLGINPSVMHSLCGQRIDAKFGLSILFYGFFLQALSSAGLIVDWRALPIQAAIFVIVLAFYKWKRGPWIKAACNRAEDLLRKTERGESKSS